MHPDLGSMLVVGKSMQDPMNMNALVGHMALAYIHSGPKRAHFTSWTLTGGNSNLRRILAFG